ncbi:class I SAM-dependent methyltransferase [Thermotoga sp. KOL6]|uniref:class I SAM-dependent methyltransferase n=1 Tax=Thermotoga sp. KOL6 TaxID=126741 RepID=UPI000C78C8C2|nr:class I SAM-dependent methyltransferase [Thermotoga sp. KOL6]PLV59059.1 methyltransferase type 11 [Thermotoga sp. KOL6]
MSVAKKYDKFSRFYDKVESFFEKKYLSHFRKKLFEKLEGGKILEVGIGTGKNLPYYPDHVEIVGIDVSEGMLKICEEKLKSYPEKHVKLLRADVQNLPFEDESFDCVVSTFVFCTVPDPLKGLKELRRVLKTSGKVYFLEHMRSEKWYINLILFFMNIFTKSLLGTSMLRKTDENIRMAGFAIEEEEFLLKDVVRLIVAKKEV